ncbi:MAG: hypothetical protein ACOYOL_03005 [Chthoniobacterales bacterium]
MKKCWSFLLFVVVCGVPLTAQAEQIPACEALRTVGRLQGEARLGSLVEMRGVGGDPQPVQWLLLFKDASARGGIRELTVTKKGITSERTPLQAPATSGVMAAAGLKLDSTGAFDAANKEAAKIKLGFSSINYQLVNRSGAPIWVLQLFDHSGSEVGVIDLSAQHGAIVTPLGQTTRIVPVSSSAGSTPRPAASSNSYGEGWVEGGGLVGHVGRWSEQAWDDTTKTAERVGDSVGETAEKIGESISAFFVGRPAKDKRN